MNPQASSSPPSLAGHNKENREYVTQNGWKFAMYALKRAILVGCVTAMTSVMPDQMGIAAGSVLTDIVNGPVVHVLEKIRDGTLAATKQVSRWSGEALAAYGQRFRRGVEATIDRLGKTRGQRLAPHLEAALFQKDLSGVRRSLKDGADVTPMALTMFNRWGSDPEAKLAQADLAQALHGQVARSLRAGDRKEARMLTRMLDRVEKPARDTKRTGPTRQARATGVGPRSAAAQLTHGTSGRGAHAGRSARVEK